MRLSATMFALAWLRCASRFDQSKVKKNIAHKKQVLLDEANPTPHAKPFKAAHSSPTTEPISSTIAEPQPQDLQYRKRLLGASGPSKTRNTVLNPGSCGLNAPPVRRSSIENATNPLNRKWRGMKSRLSGPNIPAILVELWKWFYFWTCSLRTGFGMRNTAGAFLKWQAFHGTHVTRTWMMPHKDLLTLLKVAFPDTFHHTL